MEPIEPDTETLTKCTYSTRRWEALGKPMSNADRELLQSLRSEALSADETLERARRERFDDRVSVFEIGSERVADAAPRLPTSTHESLALRNSSLWSIFFRGVVRGESPELDDIEAVEFNDTMAFTTSHVDVEPADDGTLITITLDTGSVSMVFDEPPAELVAPRSEEELLIAYRPEADEVLARVIGPPTVDLVDHPVPEPPDRVQRAARSLRAADDYEATLDTLAELLPEHFSPEGHLQLLLLLAGGRQAVSLGVDDEQVLLVEAVANSLDLHVEYVSGISDFVLTADENLARFAASIAEEVSPGSMVYEYAVGVLLGYPREAVEYYTFQSSYSYPLTGEMLEQAALETVAGDLTDQERFHFELVPYSRPGGPDVVEHSIDIGRQFEAAIREFDDEHDLSTGEKALSRVYEEIFEK